MRMGESEALSPLGSVFPGEKSFVTYLEDIPLGSNKFRFFHRRLSSTLPGLGQVTRTQKSETDLQMLVLFLLKYILMIKRKEELRTC